MQDLGPCRHHSRTSAGGQTTPSPLGGQPVCIWGERGFTVYGQTKDFSDHAKVNKVNKMGPRERWAAGAIRGGQQVQ